MHVKHLKSLLEKPMSKAIRDEVIREVSADLGYLDYLVECFSSSQKRIVQNASWAYSIIAWENPQSIETHHNTLINILKNDHRDTIVRNIVRIYQNVPIPEYIESELYSTCFNFLENKKTAIAIQAFSMTVCYKIAKKYPDLAYELTAVIKSLLPNASPGVKNRASKVLKDLERLGK